ncbi:leptin receptor gene-related protein isoform X2 [Halyomorpha halys]
MTLIILACALPDYKVWWPFMVVLFYLLAPVPTLLARRYTEHTGSPNSSMEVAIFITMFFVVSSFALPIVLARSPVGNPAFVLHCSDTNNSRFVLELNRGEMKKGKCLEERFVLVFPTR